MNFTAHFTFGFFLGLLVIFISKSTLAGFLILLLQVVLLADHYLESKPFHTVIAMGVVWIISIFFTEVHWAVLLGYASHLALDIFTEERIYFLYPSKKLIRLPIFNSDNYITYLSMFGIVVMTGILFLVQYLAY